MKIRVGDKTFRASQLEKCMTAMALAIHEIVTLEIACAYFSATVKCAYCANHGVDQFSPFTALCRMILSAPQYFQSRNVEVVE